MKRIFLFLILFLSICIIDLKADDSSHNTKLKKMRADAHAPYSIMLDHYHKEKEIMLSYRFMTMKMDGYLSGTSKATYTDARTKQGGGNYMVVPQDMDMHMHMFGGMYALSDDITFAVMSSYLENEMKMKRHANGAIKTMKSSGIGDTKINALKRLYQSGDVKIHATLGLSLPTGSISEEDTMFSGSKGTLGYGMQLGSGTYDLHSSATYFNTNSEYSFGIQISGVKRIGENSKDYALGDIIQTNIWGAIPFNDNQTSISVGSEFKFQEKIDGSHKDISSIMSFAQDKEASGFKRIDLSFGINHVFQNLRNLRFAIEFIKPVYNDVNHVQLETDHEIILGIQYNL
mgnify:CR=1 FL=1